MKLFKQHYLLILIIIVASVLRLWSLNNFPAGLNADEAALGYNAYSLLQTGQDEYGTKWPLVFKSFGDYKPGLYVYIVMPFVAIMGLSEWAVRIPSAILGIATVLLIYFLAQEIFQKKKVALTASFLLAISPWHIHFSRGGWESNVSTFFITLGIYFFIKGFKKNIYFFWSLLTLLISMYTYQSPRLIVPILVLILTTIFFKKINFSIGKISLQKKLTFLLILVFLSIPLGMQVMSASSSARFEGLSFLSDSGPGLRANELRGDYQNNNSLLAKIMYNKIAVYSGAFWGHYLDHFNPDFLFINGDQIIRNKVPETGQFYSVEIIFLIVGLAFLFKNTSEYTKILPIWILIAPLASAMTYQTPNALRAFNMVVPMTLVISFGFYIFISWFKAKWKIILLATMSVVLIYQFSHYLDAYYIHLAKKYPLASEYGFKQMVVKLNGVEDKYKKVVITDKYDQPYILVLFFKQYDPLKYQPQAKLSARDKFNFGTVRGFDKYEFRQINPEDIKNSPQKTLFIGTITEMPSDVKILDSVDFPNGQPAFLFAEGLR